MSGLVPELDTVNYVGSFHFRVNIPDVAGDVNQAFTRVSGVVSASEPMEFMHGTHPYVRKGVGREVAHEAIKEHAVAVALDLRKGARVNDLLDRLKADDAFAGVRGEIDAMVDPQRFIGIAPRQVERFLAEEVAPALAPYRDRLGADVRIDV